MKGGRACWLPSTASLLAGWFALAPPATGAGLRDVRDGWLLGEGGCATFLAADEEPAPADTRGTWLLAGRTRLFGLPDLPLRSLTAGWRPSRDWAVPALTVGWEILAAPLWREESRRLESVWGHHWQLGVVCSQRRVRSGGGAFAVRLATATRVTVLGGATWRAGAATVRARLGLPLQSAGLPASRPARTRLLRMQVWSPGLAAGLAIDRRADGAPVVGLSAWLGANGWAWGWRCDPATGTVGPVLAGRHGAWLLRTSHLAHPHLGVTHRVQIGFGRWGAAPW